MLGCFGLYELNFSSLDQPDENQNDCDDQKNMYETAQGIRRDESKQPGNDQNEGDRFEHGRFLCLLLVDVRLQQPELQVQCAQNVREQVRRSEIFGIRCPFDSFANPFTGFRMIVG